MGFYTDILKSGNVSGQHYFDAVVLSELAKIGVMNEKQVDDSNGEKIKLLDSEKEITTDITLHRNGRTGQRDLSKDTVVIPIERLAAMPDEVQAVLYLHEQVPEISGRRPGVSTVKRPLPTDSKVIGGRP